MLDHPEYVADVHRAYFRAGATVATTNTYAVHRDRLPMGNIEDKFEDLLATALTQAEHARSEAPTGKIAASLGPLGASYRTDVAPPLDEAVALFREVASLVVDRADLLLIETVASVEQAKASLRGATGLGKPVWLAVSVKDDDGTCLRSGEPLGDLAPIVAQYAPDAVLINCSRPEAFGAALEIVAEFGKPFGGYANGFTHISDGFLEDAPTVDALTARQDLSPKAYAEMVLGWVDQGATIVGGCCEVGPAHIAEIKRRLEDAGHRIV
jgi:homocysteine S-methyltransferase